MWGRRMLKVKFNGVGLGVRFGVHGSLYWETISSWVRSQIFGHRGGDVLERSRRSLSLGRGWQRKEDKGFRVGQYRC